VVVVPLQSMGQPEVTELPFAVSGEHVSWLHVQVDDAVRVRVRQPAEQPQQHLAHSFPLHATAPREQVAPLHEGAGHPGPSPLVDAVVDDLEQVGVIQGGTGPDLSLEADAVPAVLCPLGRQDLHGQAATAPDLGATAAGDQLLKRWKCHRC